MTTLETRPDRTVDTNEHGYQVFQLGEFTFWRDEYFAHVEWPTGSHIVSADTFLKALQRDVAWEFFYGIVNFDGVIGTVNHYGDVDLFAGRYNDAYRKAEIDHLENFETPDIKGVFEAMLSDWTIEGFDPFAAPTETAAPFGPKRGSNESRDHPASRHRSAHGRVCRRRGAAQRRERVPHQPTVRRRGAGRARHQGRGGVRGSGPGLQPLRLPLPLGRDVEPVGGLGLPRQPRVPDDRGVHPPDHPRQRPRRVVHPSSPTSSPGTSRTATPVLHVQG